MTSGFFQPCVSSMTSLDNNNMATLRKGNLLDIFQIPYPLTRDMRFPGVVQE